MYEGKTVMITGGTSGIGLALVERFHSQGWNVSTCGRNAGAIGRLQLRLDDSTFLGMAADLRLENHVSSLLGGTVEKFGGIDACILNAGTLGPAPLPTVSELTLMDLRKTFETNVFASYSVLAGVMSILRRPGVIVHMTSDAAVQPYPGWGAYGASKAAMRQLVAILSEESKGSGLKVLNFDPGDVDTPMHALAVPDADRSALRKTDDVALELYNLVAGNLG